MAVSHNVLYLNKSMTVSEALKFRRKRNDTGVELGGIFTELRLIKVLDCIRYFEYSCNIVFKIQLKRIGIILTEL